MAGPSSPSSTIVGTPSWPMRSTCVLRLGHHGRHVLPSATALSHRPGSIPPPRASRARHQRRRTGKARSRSCAARARCRTGRCHFVRPLADEHRGVQRGLPAASSGVLAFFEFTTSLTNTPQSSSISPSCSSHFAQRRLVAPTGNGVEVETSSRSTVPSLKSVKEPARQAGPGQIVEVLRKRPLAAAWWRPGAPGSPSRSCVHGPAG